MRADFVEKFRFVLVVQVIAASLHQGVQPTREGTTSALCGIESRFVLFALFLETNVFVVCHLAMVAEFELKLLRSEVGVLGLFGHSCD